MVFEGALEKIFSIVKEEGGSEGGVVVQVIHFQLNFMLSFRHLCGMLSAGSLFPVNRLFSPFCASCSFFLHHAVFSCQFRLLNIYFFLCNFSPGV